MEKTQLRQWAKDLDSGDEARAIYLVGTANQQQAKNGPFWRLEVQDSSGSLEARIWFPLSLQFPEISAGQFVDLVGRAERFRDKLQINVTQLRILTAEETATIDISDFLPASTRSPLEMIEEVEEMCRHELTHKPWRTFALSVLRDEDIRPRLLMAPAAKGVHHAWVGGLLEHTLGVASLCLRFCDQYPELDRQTLLVGAVFHDLGKIWELSGGLANEYTNEGRLVGHINLCLGKLARHLAKSGLDEELVLHFQHLVLSHHGQLEYGSPRLPQTVEAFALHYADNLDAKLAQCRALFTDAQEGDWSPYQRTLERQLYLAPRTPQAESRKNRTLSPEPETPKVSQCSLL